MSLKNPSSRPLHHIPDSHRKSIQYMLQLSLKMCSQQEEVQEEESHLSTQHMSSRCCGTCAGLRRAGQSERRQARKALVLLERSSLARPNHRRRRLGQVHSRKHRAGISSGVRADLALPLLHSLTITGGTETRKEARHQLLKDLIECEELQQQQFLLISQYSKNVFATNVNTKTIACAVFIFSKLL